MLPDFVMCVECKKAIHLADNIIARRNGLNYSVVYYNCDSCGYQGSIKCNKYQILNTPVSSSSLVNDVIDRISRKYRHSLDGEMG